MAVLYTPGNRFKKALALKVVDYDEYKEAKGRLKNERPYRKEGEISAIDKDIKEGKKLRKNGSITPSSHWWRTHGRTTRRTYSGISTVMHLGRGLEKALKDCLENSNSPEILSEEQKERGQQHLAWIRLMDLKRAHKINFVDPPKHKTRLTDTLSVSVAIT